MFADERTHLRILFLSQYFPPEMAAGGVRVSELARHWTEQGHEVTVVTGIPNYPTGVIPPEYRGRWRPVYEERHGNVRVVRSWLIARPNQGLIDRGLNYSSFCMSSSVTGLLKAAPKPDVVIATSPPLFVPVAGSWLGYWKRVPWIFDVRDLWPESLTAVGAGDERSMLHRSLCRLASFLYQSCSKVVIVSPAFKENLVTRYGVQESKIAVIENGVDQDMFAPADHNGDMRSQFGLNGNFVVSYIGTLGMAQGLQTLADAATLLERKSPETTFLIAGGGAEAEHLERVIRARKLKNVRLIGVQPRNKIPDLIRASDACLVLLKKSDVFKTVIPTKLLEAMSCARPVIAGVDGYARKIVSTAQCGIVFEPEDASGLAQAATFLGSNPQICSTWGANGRKQILQQYTRKKTADRYLELLTQIARLPGTSMPEEDESAVARRAA